MTEVSGLLKLTWLKLLKNSDRELDLVPLFEREVLGAGEIRAGAFNKHKILRSPFAVAAT